MPTYDFECEDGHSFEVYGAPVGCEEWACRNPGCRKAARRVFLPGAWTTPRVGIMSETWSEPLGKYVGGRRQLEREMKAIGAVPKGSTPRKGRKEPTEAMIEEARGLVKDERVREIRDWREKSEYEERHGREAPPPP